MKIKIQNQYFFSLISTFLFFIVLIFSSCNKNISSPFSQKATLTLKNLPECSDIRISIFPNHFRARDLFSAKPIGWCTGKGPGDHKWKIYYDYSGQAYETYLFAGEEKIEPIEFIEEGEYLVEIHCNFNNGVDEKFQWNVIFKNGSATLDWDKMIDHDTAFYGNNK